MQISDRLSSIKPSLTLSVNSRALELKAQGLGIFLISHDTRQMMSLCDRVSVMKNGKLVDTVRVEHVTEDDILGMIIMGKKPAVAA